MVGTVQDVTERREFEREHRIADTLQQALLPERLPQLVGIGLAARYVPAEEGAAAGGDWYDVIELPDGRVALVIGDVAGHGTEAASVMGQVRMAVRAFSLEGHAPRFVVERVHDLLRSLYEGEQMVTMLYLVVDPTTWEATMVNAGHPPPLLLDAAGGATYLAGPTGLPVGLNWSLPYEESIGPAPARMRRSCCITDGLVDRRDIAVEQGLERLLEAATGTGPVQTSMTSAEGCSRPWSPPTPPTTWRSLPPGSTPFRSGSSCTSRPTRRSSDPSGATSVGGSPATTCRSRTRTTSSSRARKHVRTRSSTRTVPAKGSVDIEAEVDERGDHDRRP